MSPNAAIVEAGIQAWNAGDMERFAASLAAEVEMYAMDDWPEQGPFIGRDAVMREYAGLREPSRGTDTVRTLVEPRELAPGQVVTTVVWESAGSGPQMSFELSIVFSLRDGLITRIAHFWTRDEALAAAGGD